MNEIYLISELTSFDYWHIVIQCYIFVDWCLAYVSEILAPDLYVNQKYFFCRLLACQC
jgi:hypothetical protein